MRRPIFAAVALAMLAALPASATPPHQPIVAAHRGGPFHYPENTIPAFEHAANLGVEMLEFDLVMSADDELLVQHDPVINPLVCQPDAGSAVRHGEARAMTLAELQQFDCGSTNRPAYGNPQHVPGARMPTLDTLLGRFQDSDLLFFGETKIPRRNNAAPIDPERFAALIDEAVRRHGLEERFILQSSDYRTIDAMHRINPRIRTCLLRIQQHGEDYLAVLRRHHATCLLVHAADVDAAKVRQLREAGMLVFSAVIDDEAEWRRYRDLGVDAIFTNDPAGVLRFLGREKP